MTPEQQSLLTYEIERRRLQSGTVLCVGNTLFLNGQKVHPIPAPIINMPNYGGAVGYVIIEGQYKVRESKP